ncbi:MAG: DUF1801 domain-containing protein [Deltaproteobacteria bacterium]|nr:DUF1801 domain-containing protein [Deltaproteobacteria bacterium]MBN2671794.1 DUF1801 domain-containing protein [Deltaproteobacteria bacterium]
MPKYKNIDEYIESQPASQARLLREIRKAILEAVPDAIETFNYGVPAFCLVKNGKRDQQVMIGSFKNHVGMYPHPTTIIQFEKELSDFTQGKGSIQFPLTEPIPVKLIKRMVKYRKKEIEKELKSKSTSTGTGRG